MRKNRRRVYLETKYKSVSRTIREKKLRSGIFKSARNNFGFSSEHAK